MLYAAESVCSVLVAGSQHPQPPAHQRDEDEPEGPNENEIAARVEMGYVEDVLVSSSRVSIENDLPEGEECAKGRRKPDSERLPEVIGHRRYEQERGYSQEDVGQPRVREMEPILPGVDLARVDLAERIVKAESPFHLFSPVTDTARIGAIPTYQPCLDTGRN